MNTAATQTIPHDDRPVKWFLYPSILFMVLGMLVGVFISFNGFLFPDYFAGKYVTFGRVRPVHVGTILILFLLSADIGLFFYFIPRLCGVPIWSGRLGLWSAGIWYFAWTIGTFSYPFGTNFGWEYAELPYSVGWVPVKALVTFAWLLVVLNIFMTISIRKYQKMYVSVWYIMGTLIWTTFTWIAGTYGVNWVPGGMSRVNVSWFYIHNLVGLVFTPMGLAALYYYLPKIAHVPIYSHRLSMIGFWSIAFVYTWIGAHHQIHGPISQWLQTTSIVFSIMLFIPVWTVVTNIFGTLHGRWELYTQHVSIRFLVMGTLFYLITCIQGPLMALRNINEITSKTDWIIGHSHISLYGTFAFFVFAGMYYTIPLLVKKPIWSKRLSEWHFGLNIWGSIPFILPLWVYGFYQGMLWSDWANGSTYAEFHAELSKMPFLDTLAAMYPSWTLRAIGGIIITLGNILFAINLWNTIILPVEEEEKETREVAYG